MQLELSNMWFIGQLHPFCLLCTSRDQAAEMDSRGEYYFKGGLQVWRGKSLAKWPPKKLPGQNSLQKGWMGFVVTLHAETTISFFADHTMSGWNGRMKRTWNSPSFLKPGSPLDAYQMAKLHPPAQCCASLEKVQLLVLRIRFVWTHSKILCA